MMSDSHVSIIVLNWNRKDAIVECLASVFRNSYRDFDVILIDNASDDESVDLVRAWVVGDIQVESDRLTAGSDRRPEGWREFSIDFTDGDPDEEQLSAASEARSPLTIIRCSHNLGYAGGHNLGIKVALARGAPLMLLLNSDVVVRHDFLLPLIAAAEAQDVAAVGPLVLTYDAPDVVWQAGACVDPGRGLVSGIGRGRRAHTFADTPAEVDSLVGCAVLVKADALRRVGLLDIDYFLYLEESDWFARAGHAGLRVLLAPASMVWHKETVSSIFAKSDHSAYYFARNRLLFTRKNYRSHLPMALLWSLRYGILNNLVRRRWRPLAMSILGIWDFLAGKRGKRESLRHTYAVFPNVMVFSVDYKPLPGGIAEHAYKVARHLADRGISVVVLAPSRADYAEFDRAQPFRTYRVVPIPVLDWAAYLLLALYVVTVKRIGLVYCATAHPCGIICLLLRLVTFFRFTVTIHAHEVVYSGRNLRQKVKKTLKRLQIAVISAADRVYAVSDFTRAALIKAGADEDKISTVYNGIDIEDFDDISDREKVARALGIEGKPVILTVSRLDVHKGHDVVIEALPSILKRVPDAVYVIAGSGRMGSYLRELASDLGVADHVVFAGRLPKPDIFALYGLCDLFVMASRIEDGSAEGFGIVFLEAAAFHKPVVGGKSGGIPDAVVDGVTGILVDPEDPREVAGAIVRILVDPQLAGRLGKAGYERAISQFTWDMTVDRILKGLNAP